MTVAASYTDLAGNAGTGTTSANYAIDTKAPIVTITSAVKNEWTITGTLTEVVAVFKLFVIDANGTPLTGQFSINPTPDPVSHLHSWTFTIQPQTQQTRLKNNEIVNVLTTDAAGNTSIAAHKEVAPAGIAGEAIDLGLSGASPNLFGPISVAIHQRAG